MRKLAFPLLACLLIVACRAQLTPTPVAMITTIQPTWTPTLASWDTPVPLPKHTTAPGVAPTKPPVPTATATSVEPTPTPEPTATPQSAATPTPAVPTATPTPAAPTATPTPQKPTPTSPPPTATKPPAPTATPTPAPGNVLTGGDFEGDFTDEGVGAGWHRFFNGDASFFWAPNNWPPVVASGAQSQGMTIADTPKSDRYIGIYQTVSVVAGASYKLELSGLIRVLHANPGSYDNQMQWGVDQSGGTDWTAVTEWKGLGWDEQDMDVEPTMGHHTTTITAQGNKLTLFIRGWVKWPKSPNRAEFYVDNVSLVGPKPR